MQFHPEEGAIAPDLMSGDKKAFADTPHVFEPGTAWIYGMGADLAAEYVVNASGKNLRQAIREYVLEPLKISPQETDPFVTEDCQRISSNLISF